MDYEKISVIGIVVGQLGPVKFYIWTKEANVGVDGILLSNPNNPIKMGDWVQMNFTKKDYELYFPNQKRPDTLQFRTSDYIVKKEMYKTEVIGKTIKIKMDRWLGENQQVIEDSFFGKIYNTRSLQFPSGQRTITFKRIHPSSNLHNDSVWSLDSVEYMKQKPETKIIGIVVAHHKGSTYIWCKERPRTKDVIIKNAELFLGQWITFSVKEEDFNQFSSSDFYEINQYETIQPTHSTQLSGKDNKTVNLKLTCYIQKNEIIQHPFVGVINRTGTTITQSGKYSITINRTRPKNGVESVWFLRDHQLIETVPEPTPIVQAAPQGSLSQLLEGLEMHRVSASLSRYSRLEHQTRVLETHSENSVTHPQPPIPAPRRIRSRSRPNRSRSRPRAQSRPRGIEKRAIIRKIRMLENKKEAISVWLVDDHRDGMLNLEVPAEKLDLRPGSMFSAAFQQDRYSESKMISFGPATNIKNDLYMIRGNDTGGIDIRIYAENLLNADGVNRFPRIMHEDFGDILDTYNVLTSHIAIKYHMWIRRVFVKEVKEQRWVVVEQIKL